MTQGESVKNASDYIRKYRLIFRKRWKLLRITREVFVRVRDRVA